MVKYLSFHNSSFALRHTPCFQSKPKKMSFIILTNPPMFGDANLDDLFCASMCDLIWELWHHRLLLDVW